MIAIYRPLSDENHLGVPGHAWTFVNVLRPLSEPKSHEKYGPAFMVRFKDGREHHAYEAELLGTPAPARYMHHKMSER